MHTFSKFFTRSVFRPHIVSLGVSSIRKLFKWIGQCFVCCVAHTSFGLPLEVPNYFESFIPQEGKYFMQCAKIHLFPAM